MTRIEALSTKDLKVAIVMGQNNISGLHPEFQAQLQERIDLMHKELAKRLTAR